MLNFLEFRFVWGNCRRFENEQDCYAPFRWALFEPESLVVCHCLQPSITKSYQAQNEIEKTWFK